MDISVISVNYNNSNLTLNFVKSVIQHTPTTISYEVIIVDNCSEKNDYYNLTAVLSNYKDRVTVIRSNINTGFGGGNMLGTQHASGRYLAFINNDVLFTEDCLSSLKKFMTANTTIAVSAPQQLDRNNKPTFSFDHFHGVRKEILGRWAVELNSNKTKRAKKIYTEPVLADFVQGSFMFFDAQKFAEVGGFDTNIFLYYEEMDICYRLKQKGYLCYLYPETSFIHLHGVSTPDNYLIKKELKLSKLYVLRKNHNYIKYNTVRLYFLSKAFFKSIIKPNYWDLFYMILTGTYLKNSLKQKQKIVFLNTNKNI